MKTSGRVSVQIKQNAVRELCKNETASFGNDGEQKNLPFEINWYEQSRESILFSLKGKWQRGGFSGVFAEICSA
jgi:hypothetical protein